jgi:tight adherence protein B
MTVTPRRVAVAALGLLALLLVAGPASAAAPNATITVRRVDTTAAPKVTVDFATSGHTLDTGGLILVENGRRVTPTSVQTLSQAQIPTVTVLVVDTADSMNGAKIQATQAALKQLIGGKGPADQMAIVAFGGSARTVQDFTADPTVLDAAVDRLSIGGSAVLNDGVRLGANLLGEKPRALPQLVVIADSNDKGSTASTSTAAAEVLSSHALVYTIGMAFVPGDLSGLAGIASAAGGTLITSASPITTPEVMRVVMGGLHDQYRVTYDSGVAGGHAGDLEILAPGLSGRAQIVPGGVSVGLSTNPSPVHLRQAPGLLQGKAGLLLVAVLVLAAAALLTYAAALLVSREGSALTSALIPFNDSVAADKEGEGSLIQSAIVQRAVDATGRLARERGLLELIENKLEQADLALRPAEALFIYLIGGVLVTVVALVAGGPLLALIALVGVGLAPPAILSFLAAQRLRKFTSQLPDTLQLLASSLRAGFSFLQGVEAVAQEVSDPMGAELRRVMVEARLGRPVEESLDDCARRMRSDDFDWAVMAVNIQREVGGNLADLLQTVSVTMIERERLRRDVKALTAEGRMSAIVLGCLPPGLAMVFYATNPAYIRVLFTHLGGQIALGLAVFAMLIGFFWMKKIVDIKV